MDDEQGLLPEFDDDGDDLAPPEIPPASRVLRTQAYDKAVSDLVGMIDSKDIVLDPDYQRNYVWDNRRASLLVESFLLNVPIPIIYVSEEPDGAWSVVDGLQRLTSLHRFFNDEFKLTKLEVFQELNGLVYSKLPPREQRALKNGILRIILVLQESHPEIKYDIFQRLNRGSIRLNEQELRNCLYRTPLTAALREAREDPAFLRVIGLKAAHNRFYDAELILRTLAIAEAFDPELGVVAKYPNKMRAFLNAYMEQHKGATAAQVAVKIQAFQKAITRVETVFGASAFRRYVAEEGENDTRLNRALMDAVMAAFWGLDDDDVALHADALRRLPRTLTEDDKEFGDALIYGTSDKKRLEYRVKAFYDATRTVVKAD